MQKQLNKRAIAEGYRNMLGKEFDAMKEIIEQTKVRMVDAPGAMQSHSDTSKVQLGWLIDGYMKRFADLEGALEAVNRLLTSQVLGNPQVVHWGSLVTLSDGGKEITYFVISHGEGRKFTTPEGEEVVFVNPAAPVAKALIGKEEGDAVEIKGKEYEVVRVV